MKKIALALIIFCLVSGLAFAAVPISQFLSQFQNELAGDQAEYAKDVADVSSDNQAIIADNNDMNTKLTDEQAMLNDETAMNEIIQGIQNGTIQ